MSYDIALTEHADGVPMHWANCPEARLQAELGLPVATLFGCRKLPKDIPRHSCMR